MIGKNDVIQHNVLNEKSIRIIASNTCLNWLNCMCIVNSWLNGKIKLLLFHSPTWESIPCKVYIDLDNLWRISIRAAYGFKFFSDNFGPIVLIFQNDAQMYQRKTSVAKKNDFAQNGTQKGISQKLAYHRLRIFVECFI